MKSDPGRKLPEPNDTRSEPADLSPKQRYELERWARLNGMTLAEFIRAEHEMVSRRVGAIRKSTNSSDAP